jgi:hypothetical protein
MLMMVEVLDCFNLDKLLSMSALAFHEKAGRCQSVFVYLGTKFISLPV